MNETERTVLRLYGDGMTVKEISLRIRISENMVRQYLRVNGVRKKKDCLFASRQFGIALDRIDQVCRSTKVGSRIRVRSVKASMYGDTDLDAQGNPVVKYVMWTHSFIPTADKLREHIIKDKMPYDAWERLGYLTLTNTPIVDQNFVMKYILDECEKYNLDIQCLCFDPANASKLMTDLSDQGYTVEEVFQSHKSLNESTQGFREQVFAGNVAYTHNPLLNYAMSNAVIRTNNGLIKIDKDATTKRIDPIDATLAAFKLALYHDFEAENINDYVAKFLEGIG